jgi:hypothetical protein
MARAIASEGLWTVSLDAHCRRDLDSTVSVFFGCRLVGEGGPVAREELG